MFPLMSKLLLTIVAFESLAVGDHQKENSKADDPPCFFNPLCTCSKAYPDLGRVTCKNIPLITIPQQINTSKVFMLHLENNGLRYVEPFFFKQTGLLKIEISQNFLTDISEETFSGLGRSLWELNLQHNRFRRVPNQSFRYLKKLKLLDLSGNEIVHIKAEDWLGLEDSLKSLILSDNKLSTLRPRTFSMLRQLESLDLSGNALIEFDAFAFKDGPPLLKELNLADNLLSSIPFQELSELRELRHLDLSFNIITDIQDSFQGRSKAKPSGLALDTLRLDYNAIQHLPAGSFKTFSNLNRTYLNGNPIASIEKDAFQRSKIRELYLADCKISDLTLDAFFGLQNSLEVLDLRGNNLTTLPPYILKDFKFIKSLNLENNFFKEVDPDKIFAGYKPSSLLDLYIGGEQNPFVDLQNLQKLPNLRLLSLSKLPQPTLSSNDLPDSLNELEEIKISHSNVKTIKNHVFKNVRGLQKLDLSENSISTLEEGAFSELGHTLLHLSLSNGLSSTVSQLPANIFDDLTSLKHLDLSDNGIKVLNQKLFRSMKQLEKILIQDNFIEFIPKRAFQTQIHAELNTIQLSFNQLSSVDSQIFSSLNKLEYLWLNDNKITSIERRAFVNLERLRHLYLRGNRISLLKEEAFLDLPALEKLDLAYNKLRTFSYDSLEQIGTLSSFTLNVSNNAIEELKMNSTLPEQTTNDGVLLVNIKALDLSHNNISYIEAGFFSPIEATITHLYLSHNIMLNITQNVFGEMMHLQWLDVSHNQLKNLDYNAFAKTKNLQVLYLGNNRLQEIPKHIFRNFNRLRVLGLGSNNLHSLPEDLFSDAIIRRLDLSDNQLNAFPVTSFDMDSASLLTELNVSQNAIVALPPPEVFAIFQNLYSLDLSGNQIIRIEDGTFAYLRRLHFLDLSHNIHWNLNSKGQTFHGLEITLQGLILRNLSLKEIPALRLHSLLELDVSDNDIVTVPFEIVHNLTKLEKLELSGNKIVTLPPAINALTKLRCLGVSRNPVEEINFQQSVYLRELDLRNISLSRLQKGALGKLPLLESLKLSLDRNVPNFNLPHLLKNNHGLNNLQVEVVENEGFTEEKLRGSFPPKLKRLTIVGLGLKTIPKNLLEGIKSPRMNLVIFNTSLEEIPEEVFDNAKQIRNFTLDVRSNKLKVVYNPNSGDSPNTPKKTFLFDLKISNNEWICDCAIGWIEGWERKRRHYLCEDDSSEECYLVSDDLRSATCTNRKPNTLIEVFKQELECGWNSSKRFTSSFELVCVLISLTFRFLTF